MYSAWLHKNILQNETTTTNSFSPFYSQHIEPLYKKSNVKPKGLKIFSKFYIIYNVIGFAVWGTDKIRIYGLEIV